jgi:hypothetical protein
MFCRFSNGAPHLRQWISAPDCLVPHALHLAYFIFGREEFSVLQRKIIERMTVGQYALSGTESNNAVKLETPAS